MENVPSRVTHLITCSQLAELLSKNMWPVGAGALLEEVCHWGWAWGAQSLPHFQFVLFASHFGWRWSLSASCSSACCYAFSATMDSPFGAICENSFFCKFLLVVVVLITAMKLPHKLPLINLSRWSKLRQRCQALVTGAGKYDVLRKGRLYEF